MLRYMKTEQRRLASVGNTEFKRVNHTVIAIFSGRNTAGKETKFHIALEWWIIPYLIRELTRAWIDERRERLVSIANLNEALPDKDAQL